MNNYERNEYQSSKHSKRTRKRIEKSRSGEHSDYASSNLDTFSRNSRGSYKLDYLMSKAFTPIVPSNNQLHEISKISWNRKDLIDNISYSGITESFLLGRNSAGIGMNVNNTDNQARNGHPLISKNNDYGIRVNHNFKSPEPNSRLLKNMYNIRSLSNGKRTISSISGMKNHIFPPIGFGGKTITHSRKGSFKSQDNSEKDQLNEGAIISPKDSDSDKFRSNSSVKEHLRRIGSGTSSQRDKSKMMISKNQIFKNQFNTLNKDNKLNISRMSNVEEDDQLVSNKTMNKI